jgi:hypothetical protein
MKKYSRATRTTIGIFTLILICTMTAFSQSTILEIPPLPNFTAFHPNIPEMPRPPVTNTCAGKLVISFRDVTTPEGCGNSYVITRTWTASNSCGQTATAVQTTPTQFSSIHP